MEKKYCQISSSGLISILARYMFLHAAPLWVSLVTRLFKQTHFKHPVLLFLLIQMHLGLAQRPALGEWFRGQVKLHPLQVETQTGADGFDEALFQGLG